MSSGEFHTVLGKNCFIKGKSTTKFRAVPLLPTLITTSKSTSTKKFSD